MKFGKALGLNASFTSSLYSIGILDDQDLVETLQQSKGMAKEIYERIAQSEDAEKRLSLARKRFLPVCIFIPFSLTAQSSSENFLIA